MTAAADKTRNVYQRKLAVMRRCSAIKPDKTHPHHRFDYVSIQNLENHLREFCAEEGLDVQPSISDGVVTLTLTNADKPDEQIVSSWPVVDGDKGWAFSVKFPLVRTFHVGDGEENDEADMANKSAQAASTQAQRGTSTGATPAAPARAASSPRPASNGTRPVRQPIEVNGRRRACPECGDGNLDLVLWPDGNRQISCSNWQHCKYRERVPDESTAAEHVADVAQAVSAASGSDVDPDDTPF